MGCYGCVSVCSYKVVLVGCGKFIVKICDKIVMVIRIEEIYGYL